MKISKSFQHDTIQGFRFGSWPFGEPKLFVHLYFIDGLLIDTGHSNMRKDILRNLSQLAINQVFITHHHEDHSISSIFKELSMKRSWRIRILSTGELSTLNMIKSVIRDEQNKGLL